MKLIYIASPYSIGNQADNVRRQVMCAKLIIEAGHAAYVPLLNHFQHLITPMSEDTWIHQDLAVLERCDGLVRLEGESRGADREVEYARALRIPVYQGEADMLAAISKAEVYPKRFRECV